jgi:hypothetical protein
MNMPGGCGYESSPVDTRRGESQFLQRAWRAGIIQPLAQYADEALDLPPTCRVLGWRVFGPGLHKGTLYSPAMCQAMAANFQRLSTGPKPYLSATVKLGHDPSQAFGESLGLPSFGKISGCRVSPNGDISIDLDDVPTQLGQAIAAGLFKSGSIEIPTPLADPDDPRRMLSPVLSSVALLGGEQPAVKGFSPPVATFEDGTPVPAATNLSPWLSAMGDAVKAFSDPYKPKKKAAIRFRGREYSTNVISFAEMHSESPVAAAMADPFLRSAMRFMPQFRRDLDAYDAASGPNPYRPTKR